MVEYRKQDIDLIFFAMADASRRQLLQQIIEQPYSSVLKLAEPFNVSLNAISKHLKVLEKAGLIQRTKKGREYYFTFNPQVLGYANYVIIQLMHEWEERLDALDDFLTNNKKENSS